MNPNNSQNQNNFQGQVPNNIQNQYGSQQQVPIGQPIQQYQQVQQQQQVQSFPQSQQQGVQIVQENIVQPRQISPEEVLQVQNPKQYQQQMTQQELQRTQVLNIDEVEKAARYERISSKKPAIAVAVLGVLFLAFGTTFQIASNLKSNHNKVEKRDVAEEVVEKSPVTATTNLNCIQTMLNKADGTDTVFTIQYIFEEDKLVGFKKIFNISPTPGNPLGPTTIQTYTRDYQAFLNPTEGYQISVVPNGEGLTSTVEVDYTILDLDALNPIQGNHYSTKVDYPLDTKKEVIQADMLAIGFVCE